MLETAKCAPRSRKTLLRPEIYSSRRQTAKCSAKPCVASCLPTVLRKLASSSIPASRCRPPPWSGSGFPSGGPDAGSRRGGFEQCWRQRNAHLEVERRFSAPRFILLANRPPNAPQNHALPRACPRCFESCRRYDPRLIMVV